MWTPIFKHNKENVLDTLGEYIQNLQEFKQLLENDDYDGIYNEMNDTNKIREILKGIPLNKWKVESGKWKVESGKWKVESGKWKVESDKASSIFWNINNKPEALKSGMFMSLPARPQVRKNDKTSKLWKTQNKWGHG